MSEYQADFLKKIDNQLQNNDEVYYSNIQIWVYIGIDSL